MGRTNSFGVSQSGAFTTAIWTADRAQVGINVDISEPGT
jgi:hypothetical protein